MLSQCGEALSNQVKALNRTKRLTFSSARGNSFCLPAFKPETGFLFCLHTQAETLASPRFWAFWPFVEAFIGFPGSHAFRLGLEINCQLSSVSSLQSHPADLGTWTCLLSESCDSIPYYIYVDMYICRHMYVYADMHYMNLYIIYKYIISYWFCFFGGPWWIYQLSPVHI